MGVKIIYIDALTRITTKSAGGKIVYLITDLLQIGETNYEPKNAKYFRFALKEEMDGIYKSSRVVVCHAGSGSIITALKFGKPVIAIPRRKKYGEHVDDYQLEIARALEKERRIIAMYDIKDLENALMSVSAGPNIRIENDRRLAKALREYIDKLTM